MVGSSGDQEIFTLDEMIAKFDIANVNKAASSFDVGKLRWLNQHYIKEADADQLGGLLTEGLEARDVDISSGPEPRAVADALRERAQTIDELVDKSLYFYSDFDEYDEGAAKKHLRPVAAGLMSDIRGRFERLEAWQAQPIHDALQACVEANDSKLGKIAQPLRVAVSGTAATPPIDITLELVGKERTLERIDSAIGFIAARAEQGA